jgi:hypothetical protein
VTNYFNNSEILYWRRVVVFITESVIQAKYNDCRLSVALLHCRGRSTLVH